MTIIEQHQEPWSHDSKQMVEHATILIALRHAEYGFPTQEKLTETYFSFEPEEIGHNGTRDIHELPEELWADYKDEEWGTFLVASGPLSAHHNAFEMLAGALMPSLCPAGHRPGGDCDYFDYWPGGMECLRDYADDLQEAYKQYPYAEYYQNPGFLGVYHNVLTDFLVQECRNREDWLWEHIPALIAELARDKGKTEAEVQAYIERLAEVKL